MRDLYQFFVHDAYDRGSVFLRRGGEIPKGKFWGFSFPLAMHCKRSMQKGSFNIGREGGDGSAQRGRSVIYDCLVYVCQKVDGILSKLVRFVIQIKRRNTKLI